MPKKILLLLGHPQVDSFCAALAERYIETARATGHDVRLLRLGDLAFDPVLKAGFHGEQPLEPDLLSAQESVRWAEHLVLVYPTWWGGPPALLKGFVDRVFLPGFAFKYRKGSAFWDKLLSGRTAEFLVTLDTPPWLYRWFMGAPGLKQMRDGILGFCGIKTRRVTLLGPVRGSTDAQRADWLEKAAALGAG